MGNKLSYNIHSSEKISGKFNEIQPDISSFVNLKDGYGYDKNSIFYMGRCLNIPANELIYLKDGYGVNNTFVFFKGYITQAEPKSFKVFTDGYARDTYHLFYKGDNIAKFVTY